MYTVEWALEFEGFSKEESMDLHKFVLFYDEHIAEKNFIYTTTSAAIPSFMIEARKNQLPHLIGLQHWKNLPVKQPGKQYEFLFNGEWGIPFLEKADAGAYEEYRARIEFLPNMYKFLYKCECQVKLVHPTMPSPFKNRRIDMIFQKAGGKLVYVLELREKRDTKVFVLASITVHNKNAQALKSKFLPVNVISVEVNDNTEEVAKRY